MLRSLALSLLAGAAMLPHRAHASLLGGEALDTAADVISWFALLIVPVVLVTVFWMVHILPEKIAEKRRHPQLAAIKTLCLLSLFFGGLLWPIAWLWAYTKPVLHKLAYGTDIDDHEHGEAVTPLHDAGIEYHHRDAVTVVPPTAPARDERQDEVGALKRHIQSLEVALAIATDPARAGDTKDSGNVGE